MTWRVTFVIMGAAMEKYTKIGDGLVEYAHEAEFTAQRGLIDELFPFIFVASKRMSLRAITRWLEENHQIQISVNALSKAMRRQDDYWRKLLEDVEPAIRIVAEAYGLPASDVLERFELFETLEVSEPKIIASDTEEAQDYLFELGSAFGVIRNRWFSLPEEARKQCRRHFVGTFFEVGETSPKGKANG